LFSETAELNDDYNFIEKSFIYKTSQIEQKLNKILKIQLNNIKKGKKVNLLIILDDVQVHSRSKKLINLSTLGRHYHITVILSLQYPKQLCSSSIRNNLDTVFFSDLGEVALKLVLDPLQINAEPEILGVVGKLLIAAVTAVRVGVVHPSAVAST
jgi:ABC-type Fe3+/spermidine/putrescine transport system ATPase subunit